ncbi:unnamed protein product [Heterobilharzia americana]|nr:unnamed protein product [Heterobilharzia americana]
MTYFYYVNVNIVKYRKHILDNTGLANHNCIFTNSNFVQKMRRSLCLDIPYAKNKGHVVLYNCHRQHGNQHWQMHQVNGDKNNTANLVRSSSSLCLDSDLRTLQVFVNSCDYNSRTQMWSWCEIQFDVEMDELI